MELGLMSLEKFIERRRRKEAEPLPLPLLEKFACDFIELFAEMEHKRKSHRDIKPANFIVFDEQKLHCKLTDFGFFKQFNERR